MQGEDGSASSSAAAASIASLTSAAAAAPAAAAAANGDALPKGWSQAVDPTYNHVYYFNVSTGERTWERPKTQQVKLLPIHALTEEKVSSF
jgi:hypothetical protein